jgi:hypothetical protein
MQVNKTLRFTGFRPKLDEQRSAPGQFFSKKSFGRQSKTHSILGGLTNLQIKTKQRTEFRHAVGLLLILRFQIRPILLPVHPLLQEALPPLPPLRLHLLFLQPLLPPA